MERKQRPTVPLYVASPSSLRSSTLHRKGSLSVDTSPAATPSHHRRSNSDFHAPITLQRALPLPLLPEESSDMSESERAIREIIQVQELNHSKVRGQLMTSELQPQVQRIKREITSARHVQAAKRKTLKQALLHLLSPSDPADPLTQQLTEVCSSVVSSATTAPEPCSTQWRPSCKGSPADSPVRSKRSSACSSPKTISPEPRAQPLPLFVSSQSTNRKIVKNALTAICLAGESHRKQRTEAALILDTLQTVNYFIIVFKGNLGRQEFAGLYGLDPKSGQLQKLYGALGYPEVVKQAMVQSCYRYNSSTREFKLLPHNRLSHAVDAVSIQRSK